MLDKLDYMAASRESDGRSPVSRAGRPLVEVRDLSLWYGDTRALHGVSFDLYPREVLAFIGPSGCGKTTALKCLNRMHDDVRGVRQTGRILLDGVDIHGPGIDPPRLRRRFGWVAQKPNPFPASVYENVAYGARLHGLREPGPEMDAHVESCLRRADLWDEVKGDLAQDGLSLSGGQQQRLCIARALSTDPEILLMDEPTGSIDPIATAHVEQLIAEIAQKQSVVIITHSMMQASRVSHRVAHFHLGRLCELGRTERVFAAPTAPETQAFLSGRIG